MTSKTTDYARYDRAAPVGAPLISRKDTIIIAMLVNIALLVVLFATASRRQETQEIEMRKIDSKQHVAGFLTKETTQQKTTEIKRQLPVDEIDEIVARYAQNSGEKEIRTQKAPAKAPSAVTPEYYVIKSGDSPWKIARKYHIDFDELLKLNGLDEEKAKNLKIGQKIRIR